MANATGLSRYDGSVRTTEPSTEGVGAAGRNVRLVDNTARRLGNVPRGCREGRISVLTHVKHFTPRTFSRGNPASVRFLSRRGDRSRCATAMVAGGGCGAVVDGGGAASPGNAAGCLRHLKEAVSWRDLRSQ
jgi:hypothetical protein